MNELLTDIKKLNRNFENLKISKAITLSGRINLILKILEFLCKAWV